MRVPARNALSGALLVRRASARLDVPTAVVPCRVRYHAIGFLALNVVRRCCDLVAINVSPSLCGEVCPDAKYCQICASEDIKSAIVDMKELREYRSIDLDANPCIFPHCGHMMTVSSMDIHLGMSDYYESLDDGTIIAIKGPCKPFSSTTVKGCPKCRGGLREISRYGRLVRQALLDESTRRFICWSHSQCSLLQRRLIDEQQRLEHAKNSRKPLQLSDEESKHEMGVVQIDHMLAIHKWIKNSRYQRIIALYLDIFLCMDRVRDEEKPYKRVFDLVEQARRIEGVTGQSELSSSQVQTGGELLAQVILFRCYLLVLSDFVELRTNASKQCTTMHFGLEKPLEDCELLINLARTSGYAIQEAEGHLFFVRIVALVKLLATSEESVDLEAVGLSEVIVTKAKGHYAKAEAIVYGHSSAVYLRQELDSVGKMLDSGIFYRGMSVQAQRGVYEETTKKFTGIGGWHTCPRGHPFVLTDNKWLVKNSRCPECDVCLEILP
ncbi:hypothetical protein F4805DRAFT_460544 [Annulohypoxylon moriforme]|nr:hypothetical protein F4805DRAFT_460544 [Annulohypoxylon moriforme]